MYGCNPSTQETEAGDLEFKVSLGLSTTPSFTKTREREKDRKKENSSGKLA
jgi:hypothetical protein